MLLPWIPEKLLVGFATVCARLSFWLLWKYRVRMEENLSLAMGGEIPDPRERKALVRRAWQNFAQGVLDTTMVVHLSPKEIMGTVEIEGEAHLKDALAKGKGVIALSAHLGSFTMIGARLAAGGYPFSVVVKQPQDTSFARLIDEYRAQIGIQTISAKPRREAVRGILKALRQNEIVLVIADEFKSGGVMVDFMGQSSPAPRGPATLALRTKAATLPMFATRREGGRLVLTIGPEIELIETGDLEESVAANTAVFTRHLETMVRRYPDQWNWLGFARNGRKPRSKIKPQETAADSGSRAPGSP